LEIHAICGAFVQWIVETHGKEKLRAIYHGMKVRASAVSDLANAQK
jgi:hypothetical protein